MLSESPGLDIQPRFFLSFIKLEYWLLIKSQLIVKGLHRNSE
jgi:hypothetical protein